MICFVCQAPITEGEASVAAANLPRRLQQFNGQRVHLRCHGEWRDVRVAAVPPARPTNELGTGDRLLFAEDIAPLRAISVRQARRWLVRLEEQYGSDAVGQIAGRRGVRRYTTEAAFDAIGPRVRTSKIQELERRVAAVERRLGISNGDGHAVT